MKRLLSLILILLFLIAHASGWVLFAFFSDNYSGGGSVDTGSAEISIENLRIKNGTTEWSKRNGNIDNTVLKVNTSCLISFSVKNTGTSTLAYELRFETAWEEALNESGKLLLFGAELDDGTIFENIRRGNFDGAVIGADADDGKAIYFTEVWAEGISEVLDFEIVYAETAREYEYKLFFYGDSDVGENISLYHNKNININLIAEADIAGRRTGWAQTETEHFSVWSIVDITCPEISEMPLSKTFFIEQAADINLADYVRAADPVDGDITDRIVISSIPAFNPYKAGKYKITYNVKNSLGGAAAPLTVIITIWDFVETANGNNHSLALTSHGYVYAWGRNNRGQLGNGGGADIYAPRLVAGLEDIIDIAACDSSSFALDAGGQIYSWGHNGYGHLGDGTLTSRNKPVKVLQAEGVIFKKVSARFNTIGAVTPEGDVYVWGYGKDGVMGDGLSEEFNPVPKKIEELSDIESVEFGSISGAALSKDGQLYTWGSNNYGTLGLNISPGATIFLPSEVPYFKNNNIKIADMSVGRMHMAAISSDGRLFTWGYGTLGALGTGQTATFSVPRYIALPVAAKSVVAGYSHTAVLSGSGDVYVFGENTFGKLGTGDDTNLLSPVLLADIKNATHISLGPDASFIIVEGRTVYGAGRGAYGALGAGNTDSSAVHIKWAFVPPPPPS